VCVCVCGLSKAPEREFRLAPSIVHLICKDSAASSCSWESELLDVKLYEGCALFYDRIYKKKIYIKIRVRTVMENLEKSWNFKRVISRPGKVMEKT